jgi:hypothetical protein
VLAANVLAVAAPVLLAVQWQVVADNLGAILATVAAVIAGFDAVVVAVVTSRSAIIRLEVRIPRQVHTKARDVTDSRVAVVTESGAAAAPDPPAGAMTSGAGWRG